MVNLYNFVIYTDMKMIYIYIYYFNIYAGKQWFSMELASATAGRSQTVRWDPSGGTHQQRGASSHRFPSAPDAAPARDPDAARGRGRWDTHPRQPRDRKSEQSRSCAADHSGDGYRDVLEKPAGIRQTSAFLDWTRRKMTII